MKDWDKLKKEYEYICSRQPMAKAQNNVNHLGTLGTGNHFIEVKYLLGYNDDHTGHRVTMHDQRFNNH